jgi:hypothetical protein
MNWNTSNIIAKNYLTKNNDPHLAKLPIPEEYKTNPNIPDPLDVKLAIPQEALTDLELRVFKFAASFYLTIQ